FFPLQLIILAYFRNVGRCTCPSGVFSLRVFVGNGNALSLEDDSEGPGVHRWSPAEVCALRPSSPVPLCSAHHVILTVACQRFIVWK
uniref:Uncharacterized protein n=1 Tax=Scleropages formosus TaxID=113540 RepID=A0A8C9WGN8_SCLFO